MRKGQPLSLQVECVHLSPGKLLVDHADCLKGSFYRIDLISGNNTEARRLGNLLGEQVA